VVTGTGDAALLGPADLRAVAARVGLNPSRSLGQNFVVDPNTISRIVRAAGVGPDDVVVEVGPGLGSLTLGLLPQVAVVTAIEIDARLADELPATIVDRAPELAGRLTVVTADALRITELPGPAPTALVANLPYNIAVPVLLQLLARFPTIGRALVLVQAEVADRLAAPPGSRVYGVPSVKAAWFGPTSRVGTVGPRVFWPVPHVDSGLVLLTRVPRPVDDPPREQVFGLVDAAFGQRRKTLRAALSARFGSGPQAERVLRTAGIDPGLRAERLGVDQFVALARATAADERR
jgi:16S rRNA (adenine1518-N6/adenine1519-N6)-dimethyltransferase